MENKKRFESMKISLNENSKVDKLIGIISGKGGVGKSLVTSLLASAINKKGNKTAIIDADITGPSIPKIFGIEDKAMAKGENLLPVTSKNGIELMSMNVILEDETDPVLWRGPVINNVLNQFWSKTDWEDIDYMLIDMPPGTGDVALTIFQTYPIDGLIIVTSPQELVSMIVTKAVKMAEKMGIPILAVVENMSYFQCPDCSSKHKIFGESDIEEIASDHGIDLIAKLPMDQRFSKASDEGKIEDLDIDYLDEVVEKIEAL